MFKRKVAENLRHPKGFFGLFVASLMNVFNRKIIQFSIDMVTKENSHRIVEVGIGSGKGLNLLACRFPQSEIIGIDISKTMIKRASKRNKASIKAGKMKLLSNPIEKMEVDSASIHTLLTINTLYFWNDPNKVCKEVHRVLKPKGVFIISFNPGESMNKEVYPNDIFSFYSVDDLHQLLSSNNFLISSTEMVLDKIENYACVVAQKI